MRFHAIFPVRNEEDILAQCLDHTLRWVDAIYVFDTGSTDATWDILSDYARRDKRVNLFRHEAVVYSEGLRAYVFHHVRKHAENGDWFTRMDADEFYEVPPPVFVRERLARHETTVLNQAYEFRLTEGEVAAWEAGRETVADRAKPISERRRHYRILEYAEPRMFRYRRTMQWPFETSFPFNAGYRAVERIPLRHYPHRDPLQMQQRQALRVAMGGFDHWKVNDWRQFVEPNDAPGLRYLATGEELPRVRYTNHLPAWPKRLAQRLAHAALLPILDARRPRFPDEFRLTAVDPSVFPEPRDC